MASILVVTPLHLLCVLAFMDPKKQMPQTVNMA
jgi:hypothetical protein